VMLAYSVSSDDFINLLAERIASRFESDHSSRERFQVLKLGWTLLGDAPLWGHGYRYVQHLTGIGTHNQIIEIAVNFGVIGSLVVWSGFVLMYRVRSFHLFAACIAPTLFFTHNFFETVSLQALLGVACALPLNTFFLTHTTSGTPVNPSRYPEAIVSR
jgi:hypothetical protein